MARDRDRRATAAGELFPTQGFIDDTEHLIAVALGTSDQHDAHATWLRLVAAHGPAACTMDALDGLAQRSTGRLTVLVERLDLSAASQVPGRAGQALQQELTPLAWRQRPPAPRMADQATEPRSPS